MGLIVKDRKEKYEYAKPEAQLLRMNRALLIGCILYYDRKFTTISCITYFIAVILSAFLRTIVFKSPSGLTNLQRIMQTSALLLIVLIVYLTEKIGIDFSNRYAW